MKKLDINALLQELSELIPEVTENPEPWKKMITDFIQSRPNSTMDDSFHADLRAELLRKAERLKRTPKNQKRFWVWPALSFCTGVALSAVVILPIMQTPEHDLSTRESIQEAPMGQSTRSDMAEDAVADPRPLRAQPQMAKMALTEDAPVPPRMKALDTKNQPPERTSMEISPDHATQDFARPIDDMDITPREIIETESFTADDRVRTMTVNEMAPSRNMMPPQEVRTPSVYSRTVEDSEWIPQAQEILTTLNFDVQTFGIATAEILFYAPRVIVHFDNGSLVEFDTRTERVVRIEIVK